MRAFREAVEAGDLAAVEALLAEDVVFTSPVVFKPYPGKAITTAILRGVTRVFEDFRYERELGGADGRDHALVFTARVGERELTGCDFIHLDEDGLIDELTVMVRPLSGAQALAAAMGAQFDRIVKEAEAEPRPASAS
ncbi:MULTISPECIES: nuclear transport factor 2 family protein [unclassified Streptomyces]|uniref:nuclear transport factor 2 family protein n=1 Tax=unclassified Streptomyces TaxID=2593676 RepID=UPI0033B6A289